VVPGDGTEVRRGMKGIELKMAALIWHAALGYLQWNCTIFGFAWTCVHLPLIVTLIITLELEQVLQAVVTHSAIKYCLNLILLLTVDESCGWGWRRSSARDGIKRCGGQLDHKEDGVKVAEMVREGKVVCVRATLLT
jgi:hypothetical protein